jgi:hypothetical protein
MNEKDITDSDMKASIPADKELLDSLKVGGHYEGLGTYKREGTRLGMVAGEKQTRKSLCYIFEQDGKEVKYSAEQVLKALEKLKL